MFNLKSIHKETLDKDEVKAFDGFFVGEESARVMSRIKVDNYYDQLYKNSGNDFSGDDITDWEDFHGEYIKVEDYEEVFFEAKKKIYDLVDFTSKKLAESKSKLVRVKDLVVTVLDKRLIDYLKYRTDDYYTVYTLAELSALKELGYVQARFRANHDCPICSAIDKNVYNIQSVMDTLVQGNSIAHKSCNCHFEPFGKFYGVCDILEEGVEIIGCPIEWREVVLEKFKGLDYDYLVFGDAEAVMKYDGMRFDMKTVAFQLQKDGKKGLFIDRSYIGFDNALDYMDAAKFERLADVLIYEGLDYMDPKELKGELYIHKRDDGTEQRIVSYHNPVSKEYEFRDADTGELLEF